MLWSVFTDLDVDATIGSKTVTLRLQAKQIPLGIAQRSMPGDLWQRDMKTLSMGPPETFF